METQILYTIGGLNTITDSVIRRISPILTTEPPNPQASRVAGLQNTLKDFKTELSHLSAALRNPLFPVSSLTKLKTEYSNLFRYLTLVLAASIGTLTKAEASLKKTAKRPQVAAKGSSTTHLPWSKKVKGSESDNNQDDKLETLHVSVQHLNSALIVGTNMVQCQNSTADPKLHIHHVRALMQKLIDSVSALQGINDVLAALPYPPKTANFGGIASNATELASVCVAETDRRMTEVHSGFVPMAPLTEVLTQHSSRLGRSMTMEECLEIAEDSSADASRDTSRATSTSVSRNPSRNPSPVR